jgi:hypothetical protein
VKTKSKRLALTIVDLSKVDRAEEFLIAAIAEMDRRGKIGCSPGNAAEQVFGRLPDHVVTAGLLEGFCRAGPFDPKHEYRIGSYGPLSAEEIQSANANRVIGARIREERHEKKAC